MKKFPALIILALLLICATACGTLTVEENTDTSTSSSTTTASTANTESTPPATVPTTEPTTPDTTLPAQPTTAEASALADGIVKLAESLIGVPFADSGSSPAEGFDNSGFIYYVLRENGYISCPRQLDEQALMGESVGFDELMPGDLVFFNSLGEESAEFGGICVLDRNVVYCPMPGQSVKSVSVDSSFYTGAFYKAVRIS